MTRIVQKISGGVSETRGLTFLGSLAPQLITRPELSEYLAATIDAEDQDELARLQELYWLLGLLDPSVELYDLFLDLLGEQVLGLFNLETDELLVVAETITPRQRREIDHGSRVGPCLAAATIRCPASGGGIGDQPRPGIGDDGSA